MHAINDRIVFSSHTTSPFIERKYTDGTAVLRLNRDWAGRNDKKRKTPANPMVKIKSYFTCIATLMRFTHSTRTHWRCSCNSATRFEFPKNPQLHAYNYDSHKIPHTHCKFAPKKMRPINKNAPDNVIHEISVSNAKINQLRTVQMPTDRNTKRYRNRSPLRHHHVNMAIDVLCVVIVAHVLCFEMNERKKQHSHWNAGNGRSECWRVRVAAAYEDDSRDLRKTLNTNHFGYR